jgi:hypothetical protein
MATMLRQSALQRNECYPTGPRRVGQKHVPKDNQYLFCWYLLDYLKQILPLIS